MKLTIAAITIAASTLAPNVGSAVDFAYAESIAQQAPAIEACIADTLENLTPIYGGDILAGAMAGETHARRLANILKEMTPYYGGDRLDGQTVGEKQAEIWMIMTTRGTDAENLEAIVVNTLYDHVMYGDITAAAATQAHADIIACVTY